MLELGPDVASLLSSARSLPEAQLRDAASAAVAAVADGSPAEASLGAGAAEQQPLRDGFAGLALLMAECARLHLSPAELKGARAGPPQRTCSTLTPACAQPLCARSTGSATRARSLFRARSRRAEKG